MGRQPVDAIAMTPKLYARLVRAGLRRPLTSQADADARAERIMSGLSDERDRMFMERRRDGGVTYGARPPPPGAKTAAALAIGMFAAKLIHDIRYGGG